VSADKCTCYHRRVSLPPLEHARTCLVYVGAIEATVERPEPSEEVILLRGQVYGLRKQRDELVEALRKLVNDEGDGLVGAGWERARALLDRIAKEGP
jgi:hypothetical protein